MTKQQLYYNKEEREFYWVKQTPKTIVIDWVGGKLDLNVRWKTIKATKEKSNGNPIKQNDEDGILIYPNQAGQPFFITKATKEDVEGRIQSCKDWGIGFDYYTKLLEFI